MSIITIAGRLTKDAELRYLQDQSPLAKISIAENIYNGKEQTAQYWDCTLFGKRAESTAKYLTKGSAVTIWGEPRKRKYQGKDGIEREAIDIRITDITLQSSPNRQQAQQQAQQAQPREDIDDDIPY